MIPLCIPDLSEEELNLVKEVLDSGWLAHGPKNKQFEEEFAKYIGVKKAVSLNSCTSALHLAIEAQEITGEVILPSFTFVASANAVVTAGAKPVFADIEYATCNLDPEKIREAITDKTEAVMPVHFAGHPCKMDEILELAKEHNLKIIEDSAECIGGEYHGKKTGSFGSGCFSFYPTKNMTTGEGGMLTTDDEELAGKVKAMRGHGIESTTYEREKKEKPWLRAASYAGYNFRLCDILAAIGLIQLKKLDEMNELRRKHAAYLNKHLNLGGINTPFESRDCKHVYQMYTVKVADGVDRTQFVQGLREMGVGASVHFDPPIHLQPYYLNGRFNRGDLSNTEKVADSIVTLPMYPQLQREDLDKMVSSIEESLKDSVK